MKTILLIGVSVVVLAYLFWCWAHTESYCFFYPGIDTCYAPGFSESAFSSITNGMTAEVVEQRLGAPLYSFTNKYNLPNEVDTIRWLYTVDGKCVIGGWRWADFAWLGREITFRDGRVVEVLRHVYHD